MLKLKVAVSAVVLLIAAGMFVQLSDKLGEGREAVLLSVTVDLLRQEKGVVLLVSYKSSSSEWRGPFKHYPVVPNRKKTDPWNKTVSAKRGDTVFLSAHQGIANELTCLISVPSQPGVWSEPVTRRSIGTVKCQLVIP